MTGQYRNEFNSGVLEKGDHSARSRVAKGEEISPLSPPVGFQVSDFNRYVVQSACKDGVPSIRGDLNCDGRVNLTDFSISAFWYQKPNFPSHIDLNNDGRIDIIDFSILAFYWTG